MVPALLRGGILKRRSAVVSGAADMNKDAKDLLIRAGKVLFAEKGLAGTTVRELANKAGVNISLVSYHFEGKAGLYRACLKEFHGRRLTTAISVLHPPESHQELHIRLGIFIDQILDSVVEEPGLTMMLHREFETGSSQGLEMFREIFKPMHTALSTFLKSAQKKKLIRKDIDPKIATYLFFGNIAHIARTTLSSGFFGIPNMKNSKTAIGRHLHSIFMGGICSNLEVEG